jgi:hypothetical protein
MGRPPSHEENDKSRAVTQDSGVVTDDILEGQQLMLLILKLFKPQTPSYYYHGQIRPHRHRLGRGYACGLSGRKRWAKNRSDGSGPHRRHLSEQRLHPFKDAVPGLDAGYKITGDS